MQPDIHTKQLRASALLVWIQRTLTQHGSELRGLADYCRNAEQNTHTIQTMCSSTAHVVGPLVNRRTVVKFRAVRSSMWILHRAGREGSQCPNPCRSRVRCIPKPHATLLTAPGQRPAPASINEQLLSSWELSHTFSRAPANEASDHFTVKVTEMVFPSTDRAT